MAEARKKRKGLTLVELLIVLAVIGILAAMIGAKLMNKASGKVTDLANTISSIKTAETQWYDDQGRYAFAPRCFVDPSWASFGNVCGNPASFKGKYLDINVAQWQDCTLDPTASETDKAGCFSRQGNLIEISNVGADSTYHTHGSIVVQDLTESEALRLAGVLSGQGEHAFDGQTYASANIPKDANAGKSAGFWVEQDANDNTKYDVYVLF